MQQNPADKQADRGSDRAKVAVALSSVWASAALTLMKAVVGMLTGSIGILSEAAHSLLDLFAAALTYYAVQVSGRPADDRYHYGHGKVESVSALIETGLLFVTSGWIIYEAVHRLVVGGIEVEVTWYAVAVMVVSIVVDFFRARALNKVARATRSQALEADALHFSSDILSSTVVLIGLGFAWAGMPGGDAVAAIGVACFVLHIGWQLGKRTIAVLLDSAPEGVAEHATRILEDVQGVLVVDRVRARQVGPAISIDAVASVNRMEHAESIRAIHQRAEKAIRSEIPGVDLLLHLKPVALSSESVAEKIHAVLGKEGLSAHDICVDDSNSEQAMVTLDLEVDELLTVVAAHDIASHVEALIGRELGGGVVVHVHIDPTEKGSMQTEPVGAEETRQILRRIRELSQEINNLDNVHELTARRSDGQLYLTMHCLVDGRLTLKQGHWAGDCLEVRIRQEFPDAAQVKIHIEPGSA
jgi:cation diffusion facilitator family transporter